MTHIHTYIHAHTYIHTSLPCYLLPSRAHGACVRELCCQREREGEGERERYKLLTLKFWISSAPKQGVTSNVRSRSLVVRAPCCYIIYHYYYYDCTIV